MTKEIEQQNTEGLFFKLPYWLRRFLTILLPLVPLATLTACGSEEAPPPTVVIETHTPTTATTDPDSAIPTVEIATPMATATAVLSETEIVSARYFEKIYTLANGKTLTIKIPDNIGYGDTSLPGEPGLVNVTLDRAANLILTRYSIEENSTILIDLRTNTQTNQPELTHALSAVLLDGQIKDEVTKQVYSQPISIVFAGMETDLRDSMPLGWKNMVAVARPLDNHLLMYQQVGGNWQLAGVVSAENGVFYKYDPVIKTLTNTVDNSVIDIDPNTLKTTAGNGGLTIAFSQPDLEPSAQTVTSRALNYLEVIKTKFDVKNAHFITIGPRFLSGRAQSNIWQLNKGELKTLDSGITYNARGDNFVYVVQTTEGNIEVLELKTPFESTLQNVRGADDQLTFALNQNAYYFEATTVRGKLVVRAIPFSNLNSEEGPKDRTFVLREGVWVVEVEEVVEVLDMGEVLELEENYTGVLNSSTKEGDQNIGVRILGNHPGLRSGSFVGGKDAEGNATSEYAAQQFWLEFKGLIQDKPMHLIDINAIQKLALEDISGADEIIINAWNEDPELMAIESVSLEDLLNAPGGVEIISLSVDLVVDKGNNIDPADRYLNLTLTNADGQEIKVKTAHLVGVRQDSGILVAMSGLVYRNPESGKITIVLVKAMDSSGSSVEKYTFTTTMTVAGILTAEKQALMSIASAMMSGHPEQNLTARIREESITGGRAGNRLIEKINSNELHFERE